MGDNVKSALSSILGNKVRSLLTLLGVIIGVASVTILIALGQGLKKDISTLISGFGTNVITVIPGKIDTSKGQTRPNPADLVNGDILTLQDLASLKALPNITEVTPMSLVSGSVKYQDKEISPTLAGVGSNVLQAFQIFTLGQGRMFTDVDGPVIILNHAGKVALFGETTDGVGKVIKVANVDYTVIGVLNKPKNASVVSSEFDTIAFIPFNQAKVLNKGQVKINRLVIKATDDADIKKVKSDIISVIKQNHQGEENFSALTQDDLLGLIGQVISLITAMVSAIAAISLAVGGIGIMNIMLVTVTERTREIGLRKALGATQGAILVQFLTEAMVITLLGGLIGLGIAYSIGRVVAYRTTLEPVFSWQVVVSTVVISVVIGVIFGLWPALRAARKDPIDALRYE